MPIGKAARGGRRAEGGEPILADGLAAAILDHVAAEVAEVGAGLEADEVVRT
jgi:hypothetical protein